MSSSEVFSDRYELVRHIARGGMAQVYMAKDLLLDRPVAIKVLFPELSSDPSFVERFRREAQAAANLSHANIVSIYDWGQGEHTYFIVMEYIDGQTLSSLIRQGPLPPMRAASIGADIASALDFAHRRGVIHRDVKPGNVLIDRNNQVKVADFGIARAVSNASEGLTQTGAVMGTATYFSPEQAQGQPVDARSDVYSLGVVLYEMVTGRPPFAAESPVAIAYKHVREQAELPSSINPAVPQDFEAIVMAAMAKNPEDRYQSAADLADDLARFHSGQQVLAPVPGPPPTRAVTGPPPYYSPYDETYVGETRTFDQMETAYGPAYATGEMAPRRSRAWWWATLFVTLLAVLAVLVYFIGRNDGWWGVATSAKVPAVAKDTVAQAESDLKADGFKHVKTVPVHSTLVPVGHVVGVSPAAGKTARFSSVIRLSVSSGGAPVSVPDVDGKHCTVADDTLKKAGFNVTPASRTSSKIASGLVISTKPVANQKDAKGSFVTVYCSLGPLKTTVPTLSGDTEVQAGEKLQAAHLQVGKSSKVSSTTVSAGFVAYTSPPAGDPEPWHTKVNLFISSGPSMVTVPPGLDGELLSVAEKQVSAVGLLPVVDPRPVTNPAQDGRVISTHPRSGKLDRVGSAVNLYVGQYTPATTTTTVPTTTTRPPTTTTTVPPTTTTTVPPTTTTTVPPTTTTTVPPTTTTTVPPTTTTTVPPTTTTRPPTSTTRPPTSTTGVPTSTTPPTTAPGTTVPGT